MKRPQRIRVRKRSLVRIAGNVGSADRLDFTVVGPAVNEASRIAAMCRSVDRELLASSDLCRHQAYSIGERVYALQFHLEVTPEMIADWCSQDANCGDLREVRAPIDKSHNAVRLTELAHQVFGRWCDLLAIQSLHR